MKKNGGERYAGHRIMAVSWYDKNGKKIGDKWPKRGVRISFVNFDKNDTPRFRHVSLVVPGGEHGFKPLTVETNKGTTSLHAGGIAWVGDFLYVADTNGGIRVFDLRNVLKTSADSSHARFGIYGDKAYAADYRYAIPQVGMYKAEKHPMKFSFVSVDHKTHTLLSGQYNENKGGAHLARWPLAQSGALKTGKDHTVKAESAYTIKYKQMQGAVSYGDHFVTSHSNGNGNGSLRYLEANKPGGTSKQTPPKPEDVSYDPNITMVWGLTEQAGGRYVFPYPWG